MTTAPPVQQIYDILAEMFGKEMEFPARVLDKGTYDYPGSDTINAQQIKPQVVQEAEFRLANDLYGLSNMIGGPTGAKFSEAYSDIVFGLIPSVGTDDQVADLLHTDQDRVCAWLTEDVDNWTPPKKDLLADIPQEYDVHKPETPSVMKPPLNEKEEPKKIPRVDLYQKLLDAYEAERFRWVTFKATARPKDLGTATPAAIDNYNRMLANFAPIVDKKLEALWTMLLVRGQYHRIRRFIGFVDVESAPESLQRAKESLRASVMRSIDDTEDVYPVYFTPATWASKLSTAFKPEDLLSSESAVRDQLFSKQKERGQLIMKRNNVKASQQDIKPLEDAEIAARNKFLESRDRMLTGYSDTAVNLIKMYFDAKQNSTKNKEALINDFGSKKELDDIMEEQSQPPLTAEQFESLKKMQKECIQNQTALQTASEAVARTQLAVVADGGGDVTAYLYELEERVASLTMDIDYLSQILEKSDNPTLHQLTKPKLNANDTQEMITATPVHVMATKAVVPPQEQDASVWTVIERRLTKSTSYTSTMKTAKVSHLDWSVNLFFGSASGSESSSEGASSDLHTTSDTDIQIAFRCMKVVINRPWFNAGLFARSQEYYRNFRTKITPGSPEDLKKAFKQAEPKSPEEILLEKANSCVLPAYPVAFIVVKDVHIILKSEKGFKSSSVSDMQKSMSAGGGILCFSCAKSESASEHRTAAAVSHSGDSLSIKIPAPQIIGWIQQLTPTDLCQEIYGPINPKEFITLDTNKDKPKTEPPSIIRRLPGD